MDAIRGGVLKKKKSDTNFSAFQNVQPDVKTITAYKMGCFGSLWQFSSVHLGCPTDMAKTFQWLASYKTLS